MGSEILILLLPIALVHMAYGIYRSTAPGKRVRAFVLAAALSVAAIGLLYFNGMLSNFVAFFGLLYLFLFLPLALLQALAQSIKTYREHKL